MSIRIEIMGENPEQIAQSVLSMAFLFAPNLRDRVTSAQPAPAVEPVAEPTKRAARGKKADVTIDHDATEVKADVQSGGGADGSTTAAGASADASGEGAADVVAGGEGSDSGAPSDIEAAGGGSADPEMSVDELRKYVIGNYLNACYETQDERTAAFRELLDHFKLKKIADTPADKINEFKALVDAKIAEKAKA